MKNPNIVPPHYQQQQTQVCLRDSGAVGGSAFANYFGPMIGRTSAEGCCSSCRIVLCAATKLRADFISSPVLKFRSKRGKLLLEISNRREWPRRNRLLVPQ